MENVSSPIEISAEDISLGMKNERTVIIESANPAYNGKAIRVRTLRGREFRSITSKKRKQYTTNRLSRVIRKK